MFSLYLEKITISTNFTENFGDAKPLFYIKKDPAKTQGQIIHMERARRIELPYSAWEADVLPLNYARNCYFIIHHSRCRHKANDGKEIKKTCANRS